MANNCFFEMRIQGEDKAVEALCDMLAWRGRYAEDGLGRVYSFDVNEAGVGWLEGSGDCAWSVQTAMIDSSSRKLVEETKRLGVAVEMYSVEPGVGFQEHCIISKGVVVDYECVNYAEYFIENLVEEGLLEEAAVELGVTPGYMRENVNVNGDYTVGGIDNWGEFSDLTEYLERDPNEVMLEKYLTEADIEKAATSFEAGSRVKVSGDAAEFGIEDYDVRVDTLGTVLEDFGPGKSYVLVTLDEIDGDGNVTVAIDTDATCKLEKVDEIDKGVSGMVKSVQSSKDCSGSELDVSKKDEIEH